MWCPPSLTRGDVVAVDQWHAVKFRPRYTAAHAAWIFHRDVIDRRMIPEPNRVPRPVTRDTRIDTERLAPQAETEYPFHTGPVEPTRRTAVPGPSAASDMRWLGVHV